MSSRGSVDRAFQLSSVSFSVYLKVDGGQLESLCYFGHHTHFITYIVIILSYDHVL